MFAIEPGLFPIKTIVVPTLVWSNQPIKLITSISLNLVEHVYVLIELVYVLPISFDIFVKLVFVIHVQIVIPLNIFKHLPKTFFQLEIKEMKIDKTPA
jgi:hypothetical protein